MDSNKDIDPLINYFNDIKTQSTKFITLYWISILSICFYGVLFVCLMVGIVLGFALTLQN